MGKFQLRKPRIISKNFPEVGSHIDNVSKSLHDVVFSYTEKVDKALQKKHMMMALSTLVLILVVGSFISPHGKADIATFYPETCLGGWLNPKYGEGEPETTSNADPAQFNDKNSAILDKNTSADLYCGNFTGTFNDATVPKKIIISLAMTNKDEITIGVATSSLETVVDMATTTSVDDASSSLLLASSTEIDLLENTSSSTVATSSSASDVSTTTSQEVTTTSTTTEGTSSFVDIIINAVSDTVSNIFSPSIPSTGDTDTVVIPQPVDSVDTTPPQTEPSPTNLPAPEESSPTSYLNTILKSVIFSFTSKAFAEESVQEENTSQVSSTTDNQPSLQTSETPKEEEANTTSVTQELQVASSTPGETASSSVATTSLDSMVASSTVATSTATTTLQDGGEQSGSSTTEEIVDTQNNFLEVFYTFDGMTWTSLGELNEISMKYRTFEIPLSASSTWSDMSQLQIKVATKSLLRETPVTYLDGIKVEVLYDSSLEYSHPDFTRDTILKDETISGMRLVTIINNETNEEETWYMYLDDVADALTSNIDIDATSTSTTATSTEIMSTNLATSTAGEGSLKDVVDTLVTSTTTSGTSTEVVATSTDASTASSTVVITPVIPKNKWFKLEKKDTWVGLSTRELVEEIKKEDTEKLEEKEKKEKEEEKEDRVPDFAKDIIKKIKGTLANSIILQIRKGEKDELWLYDLGSSSSTPQKLQASTTDIFDGDFPIGVKGEYAFWLSKDRLTIYAYNVYTKDITEKQLPTFNPALGERGRVSFDGFPWEVIVGGNEFTFFSPDTGEVFSDDDGSAADMFRKKESLDTILDPESISNLNMPVDKVATTTEE